MYSAPFIGSGDNLHEVVQRELQIISTHFQNLNNGVLYPYSTAQAKQQGWNDNTSSLNAARVAGANTPTWSVLREGIYAFSFSASIMNEAWPSPFHINHDVVPGSKLYPHIHWTTAGTNTGIVRWGIEYTFAKGHQQQAFPATQTIYLEQAASGTPYQHMIIEASDVQAITVYEPDALLLMRVFRDAANGNDTCTDAAFGLMADLHYQVGHWATKNKAPNFYR